MKLFVFGNEVDEQYNFSFKIFVADEHINCKTLEKCVNRFVL